MLPFPIAASLSHQPQLGDSHSPDRDWAGPEFWANRLQDWRVREGRLECVGGGPLRTVHLLTRRLGPGGGDLEARVQLGTLGTVAADSVAGGAGFLIGAGRGLDYRAAALIHHGGSTTGRPR